MKTLTIKADDENNAETFWAEFDIEFPEIADQVREGETTVTAEDWDAIQQLTGFSDGPIYAKTALIEV